MESRGQHMMTNPYSVTGSAGMQGGAGVAVDQGVINVLLATRPWVRLMSVVMFIIAGFMLLAALAMLAVGFGGGRIGNLSGSGLMAGVALFYALFALLYIYPARKLWSYASAINQVASNQDSSSLHLALDHQRSFWKFTGLMVLGLIALYVLIIFASVLLAAFKVA